jgi:hypothetical protein
MGTNSWATCALYAFNSGAISFIAEVARRLCHKVTGRVKADRRKNVVSTMVRPYDGMGDARRIFERVDIMEFVDTSVLATMGTIGILAAMRADLHHDDSECEGEE